MISVVAKVAGVVEDFGAYLAGARGDARIKKRSVVHAEHVCEVLLSVYSVHSTSHAYSIL